MIASVDVTRKRERDAFYVNVTLYTIVASTKAFDCTKSGNRSSVLVLAINNHSLGLSHKHET